MESTPPNAGRIAAQTARQVILQRLHEAEHHAIFEEFTGKEDDIVTARYLISKGISAKNIEAVAMGENHPVANNYTAAGKAKNRRVEISS